MATFGTWNGHVFEVSANLVRGFSKLSISASVETETKIDGKSYYSNPVETYEDFVENIDLIGDRMMSIYSKKTQSKPMDMSIEVVLHGELGCDVRSECTAFLLEAYAGATDYFYVKGEKLLPFELMLTSCSVDDVHFTANGKWLAAKLALKFSQGSKLDQTVREQANVINWLYEDTELDDGSAGASANGGNGSKKESVKNTGGIKTTTRTGSNPATQELTTAYGSNSILTAMQPAGREQAIYGTSLASKTQKIQNSITQAKKASAKSKNGNYGGLSSVSSTTNRPKTVAPNTKLSIAATK